ncbi:hypothetical protein D3C76_1697570 [compost metagenome]
MAAQLVGPISAVEKAAGKVKFMRVFLFRLWVVACVFVFVMSLSSQIFFRLRAKQKAWGMARLKKPAVAPHK